MGWLSAARARLRMTVRRLHMMVGSAGYDKTWGNHMMSPDFIWFHPGAVSMLSNATFEIYFICFP
eukprot:SAG22_NODE_5316_length_1039_cov_1.091489_1_plen_64_part_10